LEKKTWHHRKSVIIAACCVILIMVPVILPMAAGNQNVEIDNSKPINSETSSALEEETELSKSPTESLRTGIYIKEVVREDSYFLWKLTKSKILNVSEIWMGDQVIARIEKNKKFILDLKKNMFYFVNHKTNTYVEASLPLNMSEILSGHFKPGYEERKATAVVQTTTHTREIFEKECDEYKVTFWQLRGSKKYNRQNVKVWSTTDVSFDLTPYYELLKNMRKVYNRDETARQELQKIRGLQLRNQWEVKNFPIKKRYTEELVELAELTVPEGTYSIPDFYSKKEHIDGDDIR
jgi:hypothetical protein